MAEKRFYYGGQAVIEGVMMRGKDNLVTAVRRPNGEIGLFPQLLSPLYTGKWRKTPFIRGVIVLIESMVLGIKTLMMSANVALEEEQEQMSPWMLWGTVLVSLAFGVAVFFLLPLFITRFFSSEASALKASSILFNLIEGLIRVAIFIAYLTAVSMMKDIRKVFAYHGAEHKAINTYEAGEPLELEYARKHTTANSRCGTSFLFAVMVIAIVVFSLIGQPGIGYMALSRVLLLPVIAALGYEFIYYTSRHCGNRLMRVLLTPGLWLQSLTTRQPDDKQLEVALSALRKVLEIEQPQSSAGAAPAVSCAQIP
jgi:uncharacterized protein YqhQ